MKTPSSIRSVALGMTCFVSSAPLGAATVQTLGSGSAVSQVDCAAAFDALNANNVVHLDTYVEGALRVTTSGDSWAADLNLSAKLDPFHGANAPDRAFHATAWGNEDWVTIQTTNGAPIYGAEFMYGNCWTTGDIYGPYPWGNEKGFVDRETWKNGVLISSGQIGTNSTLPMGTILGFYDPAGFDQLLLRCRMPGMSPPNLQTIALDNLALMLTNRPPAPVIWPEDFSVNRATGIPSLTVWDTLAGCQYRMVYAEELSLPAWIAVPFPVPDGWQPGCGMLVFSDPGAPGKLQRFYRIEVR